MDWSTPADLKNQLQRCWNQGQILATLVGRAALFPVYLRLNKPDTKALSERFDEVRRWIRGLEDGSKTKLGFGYEIEWKEIHSRQLGRNRIPTRIVVPTLQDAVQLIGKKNDADLFCLLAKTTLQRFPGLDDWLGRRALTIVDCASDWERILAVMEWFRCHPRPGLYLRQLDIPGVDTKFIEKHKRLISELLDLTLASGNIDRQFPASSFERRYGLASKPTLIRFRVLDERLAIHGFCDLTVPLDELACLDISVERVFITENEINGLSFPAVPESLVIFGLGYGVQCLSEIAWLKERTLYYWGDIDTHGFAILDRLRSALPDTQAFLMDRKTLMSHRELWGQENEQYERSLNRLSIAEQRLFNDLRQDCLGKRVRLEQERIPFGWVSRALQGLLQTLEPDSGRIKRAT